MQTREEEDGKRRTKESGKESLVHSATSYHLLAVDQVLAMFLQNNGKQNIVLVLKELKICCRRLYMNMEVLVISQS